MHELWGSDLAPLIFVAFFGAVSVFTWPIAQGIRRRLEGKANPDVARLADEIARLREEVSRIRDAEADAPHRLTELEERVDFAERLLAQQKQRDQLTP